MKWHPLLNALGAVTYIGLVVSFLRFLEKYHHDTPDTIVDGMGALSLLVCSVAVMAFLFFYHPVLMLIDNRKQEALSYFLTTLGIFGLITLGLLIIISIP